MKPPVISWPTLDWSVLDRLRQNFLAGQPGGAAYWTSPGDLANYDFTFAQRIAWKWDALLRELQRRGWTPPGGILLDWGCGSGIAARRTLESFGADAFTALRVFDRSTLAMEFAVDAAAKLFPSLPAGPSGPEGDEPIGLLVVSHVLNELDEAGGAALRRAIDRADAVLWLEPGTHADSRALIAMREALREQFLLLGPCLHQNACGLLTENNARHWCHHFATPPPGIMGDPEWVRFAKRAGVDLRSLPYSFLAMERRGRRTPPPGMFPESGSRVLGAPRVYKGFAKILTCQADGVRDLELQKRDAPEIFKAMKNGEGPTVLQGEDDGRRFNRVRAWEE